MAWDFGTDPEFEKRLEWMRTFMREEVYPLESLEGVLDDASFRAIVAPLQDRVKEAGLWAAHLPPELGGSGFGQVKLGLMHEILGTSTFAPTVFGNQAPDSGNAELIALAGTEEQRERWMRPLLAGELRSAFSMTEPGAGSDPRLITTQAVRRGDDWVLNGHKWYTSNGSAADFLIVMAVTDPDEHPYQGSSMFIVPTDRPGVRIVRDVQTMEHPTASTSTETFRAGGFGHAEILYEDVELDGDMLLGQEGAGFALAQERLGPGRIHHCMRWIGQCNRAFDMMCERAVSRYAHGSLLSEKQTIQNWVADSAVEVEAARLLTLKAAWKMDREGAKTARNEIGMIKYFGAQVLYNVIDRAIQVHGGLGYSTDMPLEAMYRNARGARIYDGPDEVHRVSVARRILSGYEPTDVPSEHIPTRRRAAQARFADQLEQLAANS